MKYALVIICAVMLSACASSNVSSQWDCPAPKGRKCTTIGSADQEAVSKIQDNDRTEVVKSSVTTEPTQGEQQEHKVWIGPYTDTLGRKHDATTLYYKG